MPTLAARSMRRASRGLPAALAVHALCACILAALPAAPVHAQERGFLFTVTTGGSTTPSGRLVSADLGYGKRAFRGLAPESTEPSLTAQIALGSRWTVLAHTGMAFDDPAATSAMSVQAEVLTELLPDREGASFFLGVGGLRDYTGTGVFLGRVGASFHGRRWEAAGNARIEHAFASVTDGVTLPRDGVDLITTVGVVRRVGTVRLGVEAVAEDLEGFFEAEEAEGGAKLMLGPTVGWAPEGARWQLLVGGGPVLRVTSSTAMTPGAPRELTGRSGYLLRTALNVRW